MTSTPDRTHLRVLAGVVIAVLAVAALGLPARADYTAEPAYATDDGIAVMASYTDPSYQWYEATCGWTTCTIYFTSRWARKARDYGVPAAVVAAALPGWLWKALASVGLAYVAYYVGAATNMSPDGCPIYKYPRGSSGFGWLGVVAQSNTHCRDH